MTDLPGIFAALKDLLKAYQPPFSPKTDREGYFDLWSFKSVVFAGRKRKEIFFAGIIIQKGYVGFYFMPVYVEAEVKTTFSPELLALLKGKSCFHIKKLDETLVFQIQNALKTGFEVYRRNEWVE